MKNQLLKSGLGIHRQIQLRSLLALVLIVGISPLAMFGCSDNAPKTYAVKNWDEVQTNIDNAKSSDSLDLSGLTTPATKYTLSIPANINLKIIGNPNEIFIGVAIVCDGTNVITIENLHLISTNNQAASTIYFNGWGNQLILVGQNSVINAQALRMPGCGAAIGVQDGATITISGDGSLTAQGGSSGAGIGGGADRSAGTITIREGTIISTGGNLGMSTGGAGLGGGENGAGGTVTISGGTVSLVGGGSAAGLGGGSGGSGGNVSISGGKINTEGGNMAAGIGGGSGGSGGVVNISGGDVVARAGNQASGLGRGVGGESSTLNITNGTLTAYGTPGAERADAIGGRVDTLPARYVWWAADQFIDPASVPGIAYPEDEFIDNGGLYFVRIEAR
ncbi:MAG: hypothetical protein LBU61_04100 [Coriobacteriales bacterium]|jgi:hypothetical protein|nr:hypothetical protein [Coriobacteriales bacterium]